jgi:hypothetical protein
MCKDWNICRKYCFGTTDTRKNGTNFSPEKPQSDSSSHTVRLFRKKFRDYLKVRTVFSLLPSERLEGLKL